MTLLIGSEGSEASFAKICHLGNNDYRSHSSNQITVYAQVGKNFKYNILKDSFFADAQSFFLYK